MFNDYTRHSMWTYVNQNMPIIRTVLEMVV
jgi:hypothetical protein